MQHAEEWNDEWDYVGAQVALACRCATCQAKRSARRQTIGVAVTALLLVTFVYLSTHPHTWQSLHTWPQYGPHACGALQDADRALRAGARDRAVDRLAEARWQYGHFESRERLAELDALRHRVERSGDLAAAHDLLRQRWHPRACWSG